MNDLTSLLQKKMTRKQFLGVSLLAAVSLTGLAGVVRQMNSRAAGPFVASEPEAGTVTNPAAVVADTTASGGQAIKFGAPANGGTSNGANTAVVTPFAFGATGATNSTVRSTVSASGGGSANTTDRTAINAAITSASSAGGGIVQLNPGTYYINGGRVEMRSNVCLQGVRVAGAAPTTILKAGTNFLSGPKWSGYSVITVNNSGLSNMTIKDVVCDQSGDTLNGNVSERLNAYLCEFRESSNVVMDGVYTRNPFTYSIVMVNCTKFGIRNCDVLSTTVGKYDQLDGIHIMHGSNGDVNDNHVDNGASGTTGDGDDGLVAHTIGEVCHDINYRNNWVRGGRHGDGLQLAGGSYDIYNITVQNNLFIGSSNKRGIVFGYYGTTNSAVYNIKIGGGPGLGNTFQGCTSYCVDLDNGPCTNSTISYNTSTGSGGYIVPSGGGNSVTNNT